MSGGPGSWSDRRFGGHQSVMIYSQQHMFGDIESERTESQVHAPDG